MPGRKRLYNSEAALRIILHEKIPGDILEAGVWRGGACIFARMLLTPDSDRLVGLCDSFEGLPPSEHEADRPHPFHPDLSLRCPIGQVRENFRLFGLDPAHKTRFVRGFFADTLPQLRTCGLALLRADGDLYISTMDILENLYAQVVPGGFVVIDD